MNAFRRAILYDTRKPGKSLTLFLLFLLVTVFMTMSFSALSAVQSAASRLRETVGASFTMRGKPLELDTDGDDYVMEFAEISPQDIHQIASNSEIRACNAQRTISATAGGFIYPSGMLSGPVSGNTESAWNTNFTNGVLTLAEGRHISKEDKSTAMVSRELAEENDLQIGSELTFSDPPATVTIIGIYESDPSMECDTDTIFTDLSSVGSSIEQVDFFVTDPAELETVMARIEGNNYTLQANTAEYDAISTQLAAIAVGVMVLFLILAMGIRGRTHEVGVYLAMGIPKRNILAQFLTETSALLLLAMAISCPISCLATVQIGAVLKSMIGTASVTISLWKLLAQYATEMAVITAGVVAAAYPAMRLQPKEILSRMS